MSMRVRKEVPAMSKESEIALCKQLEVLST